MQRKNEKEIIRLSILLPTFNEIKSGYLPQIIESFQEIESFEFIVVDSNSQDETISYIQSHRFFIKNPEKLKIIHSSSSKRGEKLNEGFKACRGKIILFHHPRSVIQKEGIKFLLNNNYDWGGFTHRFDKKHFLLNFTSWYSNNIRAKIKHIYYLDHCVFARRELLENTNIPEVEIFEDTILSQNLSRLVNPILLPYFSKTSSIRFIKNGILFQIILNMVMKLGFHFKIPFSRLNFIYEKSLELNSRVKREKM